MLDRRYKVNESVVLEIINLRDQGYTMKSIANKFNISIATVWYWACAEYRQKQREKNKKRMAITELDKARARKRAKDRYYMKNKMELLRDRIKRSLRENNYIVHGKKRSYWLNNYPHLFENKPNAKLDNLIE